MQPFDYVVPKQFAEASAVLASDEGRAWPLQGGTDLLVRIRAGLVRPSLVVDLKKLPGMQTIGERPDGWASVGAACTMNQIATDRLILERYGLLAQACNSVASYQLRNRATIGGNCCNGSPAADTAPALYCLGAVLEIFGPGGVRQLPVEHFFVAPGRTALLVGEFLSAILLPPESAGASGVFKKLGRTRAGDISIVSVAACALRTERQERTAVSAPGRWRIGLGAVGPTPLRARRAEASLAHDTSPAGVEVAAELAAGDAHPIDDLRAGAAYRRAMVRVLTSRAIEAILQEIERAA